MFTIAVPIGDRALAGPSLSAEDELGNDARSGGRILVVEDDPAVREMIKLVLDGEGYSTSIAPDGQTALDLATQAAARPDLIITDYNLPHAINGLDVVKGVQDAIRCAIPAIVLTGDIATETLREIVRCGCVHLNKPVKSDVLTQLIRRLLATPGAAVQEPSPGFPPPSGPDSARTVFVVDDDAKVRKAMCDLLGEHGYLVEAFADAEAFLRAERIDGCLLVDARMPGMSGLELIAGLRSKAHALPTIMITGSGDVPMAVAAMKAGAVDFIEKPIGAADLLASIRRALDRSGNALALSQSRQSAATSLAGLTMRQRQVMNLVLAGQPSKNIAADLGISQRTVDNHRAAIMRKTGSKSLPALIRLAMTAG